MTDSTLQHAINEEMQIRIAADFQLQENINQVTYSRTNSWPPFYTVRKLQKCICCKQWFNTTDFVMKKHITMCLYS